MYFYLKWLYKWQKQKFTQEHYQGFNSQVYISYLDFEQYSNSYIEKKAGRGFSQILNEINIGASILH